MRKTKQLNARKDMKQRLNEQVLEQEQLKREERGQNEVCGRSGSCMRHVCDDEFRSDEVARKSNLTHSPLLVSMICRCWAGRCSPVRQRRRRGSKPRRQHEKPPR